MKTINTNSKFGEVIDFLSESHKDYIVVIKFSNGDKMEVNKLENMMYRFVKAFENFEVESIVDCENNVISINLK